MWKVIIAEDEALLRRALRKILESTGQYEVCCEAPNGQKALEYLTSHRADILVSDIRMPVMDGLQLIARIKDSSITVKSIVISGYSDFEYARQMLQNGAFAYLLKPLVPEEFLDALERAGRELKNEYSQRSALNSMNFQSSSAASYMHYSGVLPEQLLNSTCLFAICMDFLDLPRTEQLEQWQMDLEKRLFPCCCFSQDDYLFVIKHLESSSDDRIEAAEECLAFFRDRHTAIKTGIGRCVGSVMEANVSMQEAKKALRYYSALSKDKYVDYERVSQLDNSAIPYPLTLENELFDAVKCGSPADIHDCILRFFSFCDSQNREINQQILTELSLSSKREFAQYRVSHDWESVFINLTLSKHWQVILHQIEDLLTQNNAELTAVRGSSNHAILTKARKYIDEHYEENLTLDEAADTCYLSKSHFCKIFKEEVGVTFKEYLNTIRIGHAKDLLAGSQLKNYEVAQKVGFEDPSYFNEVFRKITGFTPAEYKKIAALQKD